MLSSKKIGLELTGDSIDLTGAKIKSADILIATPEKWDSICRTNKDNNLIKQIYLFIIDEGSFLC